MHIVDIVAVCMIAVLALVLSATIARQRWMLRAGGAIPLAVRRSETRWTYGVARYAGGELRWYRAPGVGTRPSRTFQRSQVTVMSHRKPTDAEQTVLSPAVVVVDCLDGSSRLVLALGEGAFTGFVSWLEASAPAT